MRKAAGTASSWATKSGGLQFRGDPNVIGRHVRLDGSDRVVIGVLPRNFHLLSAEIAVWTLLDSDIPAFQ